ncbi:MAG: DNRLRE domain-containing protein, partial [Nitrososphaerota archaeon]
MTEYSVTIAGKQYFPYNVFFSKNVDFRTPGDFELIFPHVESDIQLDDTVDIKRDGTTIFRGKVETLETYKTGEDLQFHVTGRDMSVALLRLTTGRDLFQSKDPSEICETLNSPGKLIQLQSQKFIAYPEMDTYVDSYWNSGYPTYIWMYTRRYLVFPQHQRALIKFDLTNILGKIDSVTNATLYLHVIGTDNRYGNGQPDTDPKPKSYYRILGPWDESVKWTTQPSFSSTATGTTYHTHGEADIWVSVDLTSDVQAWKSGTANYGWLIRDPNEDVPCDGCSHQTRFHTSESPYTPYLVITASYNNGIVAVASASLNNSDAYKIIDQNASTYWNSGQAQASGQWVKVDLGKTYELRRIIIQMGIPNYAKNFKIEVSTNDTDYTQIYSKTNNDASTVDITITPTNARYVKVTLTGSASDQWDIYEMYFYESSLPALEIGEIQEFGKVMDFRVDYESRLDAIARLAESIGWEAWVG